ncbi:MAG: hypothetical protein WC600_08840 [Desulfobaccales bacterium]
MKIKAYRLIGLVFLALTLVSMPNVANTAMWAGVELGGNFAANTDLKANNGFDTVKQARVNPAVIGGVTIGYDFINTGFGGYNWPDWMKYFSLATDFTYNRFDLPSQTLTFTPSNVRETLPRQEGFMAAWTFLVMTHYGFLPDAEVPAGRLHPYLGVGPAVLFSGMDSGDFGLGNRSSTTIALVTETGLRFFALKNISLDAGFRFRYASPTYSFSSVDINLEAYQFSFLFRTSYHF